MASFYYIDRIPSLSSSTTMKPRLHTIPALFAWTAILAIAIYFPAIWCQETQPYDVCGQLVKCGSSTLDYPFWGLDRPAYCGHSGFEITCQFKVPLLRYESLSYRVLKVDSSLQTINIARDDLWSNYCPQYLYNTTYDLKLFNDNNFGHENVSLYYGCNSASQVLFDHKLDCNVNDTGFNNYFIRTSLIDDMFNNFVQCNNHITVPVNRSLANLLTSRTATTNDLRSVLRAGFNLQWAANNEECDQCIRSGGRCGSNLKSESLLFTCYCAKGSFPLTCNRGTLVGSEETGSKGGVQKSSQKWKLVIGFSCGIAGIMLLMLVILYRKKRLWETRKAANHQIEMFIKNYGTLAPKRYKYSEIKKMTNSFQVKLGQGGYGSVYKGQLPDGDLVAVKLLNEATGNGEDFINEVASISRTSHVNIVTLVGFCIEGKKRALMYEFMPNGSLDKLIRDDDSRLDWNNLFRIAKGIARGLEYLHQGCNTRIVHFDIKPHNILLDEDFVPKISDFGLAKLCKRKESIVSVIGARGTAGYMAPEVFYKTLGGASHKSDVYSYGMMILEMTGARENKSASMTSTSEAYFPDWVYKQVEDGQNLGVYGVKTKEEEELARKMMIVSLWCIQYDASVRPSISKVVEMLEGSFQSLEVPPRCFWSSPTRSPHGTSPSAIQSSTSERLLIVQAAREDELTLL